MKQIGSGRRPRFRQNVKRERKGVLGSRWKPRGPGSQESHEMPGVTQDGRPFLMSGRALTTPGRALVILDEPEGSQLVGL